MHPELTQFQHWLTCQYPHSSVRKHYMSDLALLLRETACYRFIVKSRVVQGGVHIMKKRL